MIKKCTCAHKYQDEKYGNKMRVHNSCKPKDAGKWWRCTVCGKEKIK